LLLIILLQVGEVVEAQCISTGEESDENRTLQAMDGGRPKNSD